MKQTPIALDTLGALAEHRYQLTGHCRSCNRHRPLDLVALADRLGRDYPYTPCRLPLTCAECRGHDVGILVSPPSRGGPEARASG